MGCFVLDSNFFIQAAREHYPFDVMPSFWKKVLELATAKNIICIDKVQAELAKNKDDLQKWIEKNLDDDFFHKTSSVVQHYATVCAWATGKNAQYKPKAIAEFLDKDEADAWLISYALAHKHTIVTHEVSAPDSKAKIKLPDVCNDFKIPYMNTIQMFRSLKVKL